MAWYNASWSNRVKLTIDSTKVSADLTDYVGYIDLSEMPAGFWTTVQNGGGDIRITKTDGTTELAREIVSCDTGTSTGEVHFKLTGTLSSSTDTDIYVYFGNSGASDYAVDGTYGRNNVWTGYKLVAHLEGNSNDSTVNANNGTDTAVTYGTSYGKCGGQGATGNGSTTKIDYGNDASLQITSDLTISIWFYPTLDTSGYLFTKTTHVSPYGSYGISRDPTYDRTTFSIFNTSGNQTIPIDLNNSLAIGSWHYVTGTISGTTLKTYVDGSQGGSNATFSGTRGTVGNLGMFCRPSDGVVDTNGYLDEGRVYLGARSDSWISTEYNNQNSVSTFYTVGSVESDVTATPFSKAYIIH